MWPASNGLRAPANFLPPTSLDPWAVSSNTARAVPPSRARARLRAQALLLAVLAMSGCGSRDEEGVAVAASPPHGSGLRLVVLLVIDQLPSWSFDAALPSLDGGLARLVERGVHYPRAELPFANTFTAAGHAAIATGAPPSVTGILANEWHRSSGDRALG